MNSRQFGCLACRKYISAAARWSYVYLERGGFARLGEPIDVERVLSAKGYWATQTEPGAEPDWLDRLLPKVREFLLLHRGHKIVYGENGNEHFFSFDDFGYLHWDDVESDEPFDISFDTLFASLRCTSWQDVISYMNTRKAPVWW